MKICRWCGVRLAGWRRLLAGHCAPCARAIDGDAGIYLQSGGPPCPYMAMLPGPRDSSR